MGFLALKVYIVCLICEMLPAIELAQRLYIFTRNFIFVKKKRKLNWFLLFYCKRCIFQLLLSVSTVVVVDSHLHWRVGSSV